MKKNEPYLGFELGPIRPPSEASSLLLRITRNCPWNRCKFCHLYKGQKFSIRSVDHVIQDIDKIYHYIGALREIRELGGAEPGLQEQITQQSRQSESEMMAFQSALNWFRSGMESIFLQDANNPVVKPDRLVAILNHIQKRFPQVERVTTYARSKSIARISDENMARIANAGLNRIHIGLESAADEVLEFVKKGVDKETHILAGLKVKQAGIELSEYFMPGLGGETYSKQNALETADAVNQINPDFIRIRTLGIPNNTELFKDCQAGTFTQLGDRGMAGELLMFLENLQDINSTIKSDHILNLFQEVDGRLPEDREQMMSPIRTFLAMEPEEQMIFMVGRRASILPTLAHLDQPHLRQQVEQFIQQHQINLDNVEYVTAEIMKRFI
jgi:hypothetical protein